MPLREGRKLACVYQQGLRPGELRACQAALHNKEGYGPHVDLTLGFLYETVLSWTPFHTSHSPPFSPPKRHDLSYAGPPYSLPLWASSVLSIGCVSAATIDLRSPFPRVNGWIKVDQPWPISSQSKVWSVSELAAPMRSPAAPTKWPVSPMKPHCGQVETRGVESNTLTE